MHFERNDHEGSLPLMNRIVQGEIDLSLAITHTFPIEDAPYAHSIFENKEDECTKVVLKPWG
jgi:threonine dehydrogenase-like Zn-dependent dehydrogenase